MTRIRLVWVLRLVASVAVLVVLLRVASIEETWRAIRSVPPVLWAGAFVTFLGGHLVGALKWRLLIAEPGLAPSRWIRAHLAGLTANLCLPGVAGGDLVRAAWVMPKVARPGAVVVAGIADRVIDVAALGLLAAVAFTRLDYPVAVPARWTLWAGVGGAGLAAAGLALVLWRRQWRRRVGRAPADSRLAQMALAVSDLRARWRLLGVVFALSLLVQSVFVGLNALFGRAMGLDVPIAAWLFAWPVAKLGATVPVSLGGLGVREAALVVLLRPYAPDAGAVVATGLLWQSVLVAAGLTGLAVNSAWATATRQDGAPSRTEGP